MALRISSWRSISKTMHQLAKRWNWTGREVRKRTARFKFLERLETRNLFAVNVFISEYVEGTSNNKAIELYNNDSVAVSLSDLRLELYSNGSTSATNIGLSGTLNPGSTFVIANPSAAAAILGVAGLTSGSLSHNGDDAYILREISSNTILDVFGVVGVDPGTEWTDAG